MALYSGSRNQLAPAAQAWSGIFERRSLIWFTVGNLESLKEKTFLANDGVPVKCGSASDERRILRDFAGKVSRKEAELQL